MAKYKFLQANVEMNGVGIFGKVPTTEDNKISSCECEKEEESNE